MFRGNRGRLFAEQEGDVGAGGGGQGAPAPEAKPLTEADVGRIVNSAVTSHLKRSLGGAITDAFGALDLDTRIADAIAKAKPPKGEPAAGEGQQVDPKLAKLEARLLAQEKVISAERTARIDAETKSQRDKAFSDFRTALSGKVRPESEDTVARLLFLADGRVKLGEDGQPYMVARKAPYAGADEEDMNLPLADGIAHWLQTPEGKLFAPAPQPQRGAPSLGPSGGPRRAPTTSARNGMPQWDGEATTDADKAQRAMQMAEAILATRT